MELVNSDVLVIGAGLAGFTAATRAAELSAKVLLIEKSSGELGDGNILMASGSLRAGAKARAPSREFYEFVMAEGVGYRDLVQAWSESCGRAVDWLIGSGVKVDENAPGRVWLDQSGEVSLAPVYKKDVGTRALAKLKERFLQFKGNYINNVEAKRLIAESGRIDGVIGVQAGAEIEFRGGATILTTGGFSANKELLKKYIGPHADQCKLRGSKQDTGDGLRMALEVGAKAVNLKYFYGHLISRKSLVDDRFWPYPRLDSLLTKVS
jgi:fumarate reductase flavoprotein subunit